MSSLAPFHGIETTDSTAPPADLDPCLDLLLAGEPAARQKAWSAFTSRYSRLLLHVARSRGTEYDRVLDRYAYILEHLQEHDFRRLRAYRSGGRGRFTTWLVVVARRLCLDHHREVYGRVARVDLDYGVRTENHAARRRLTDLLTEPIDPEGLSCERENPEQSTRRAQLEAVLDEAIDALDGDAQLLIRLRFEDDLSAAEIARVVKLPTPFHVYRRLDQILARLRRALVEAGVEDPLP
jgi:RNA polymerase sigma factor (sigma-70 family)